MLRFTHTHVMLVVFLHKNIRLKLWPSVGSLPVMALYSCSLMTWLQVESLAWRWSHTGHTATGPVSPMCQPCITSLFSYVPIQGLPPSDGAVSTALEWGGPRDHEGSTEMSRSCLCMIHVTYSKHCLTLSHIYSRIMYSKRNHSAQ